MLKEEDIVMIVAKTGLDRLQIDPEKNIGDYLITYKEKERIAKEDLKKKNRQCSSV